MHSSASLDNFCLSVHTHTLQIKENYWGKKENKQETIMIRSKNDISIQTNWNLHEWTQLAIHPYQISPPQHILLNTPSDLYPFTISFLSRIAHTPFTILHICPPVHPVQSLHPHTLVTFVGVPLCQVFMILALFLSLSNWSNQVSPPLQHTYFSNFHSYSSNLSSPGAQGNFP